MRTRTIAVLVAAGAVPLGAVPVMAATNPDTPRGTPRFHEAEGLLPALESSTTETDPATPGQAVARRVTLDPLASGNAYVRFENQTRGNRFTLRFPVPASRAYTVVVRPILGPDHGIVRLAVDGRRIGRRVDLGADGLRQGRALRLGPLPLARGDHTLTVTVVRPSRGLHAGLDYIELLP